MQEIDDDHLLAWCRFDPVTGSRVLVVVNLDPAVPRSGTVSLDLAALGLEAVDAVESRDLLRGGEPRTWPLDGEAAIAIEVTPQHPVVVFRLSNAG